MSSTDNARNKHDAREKAMGRGQDIRLLPTGKIDFGKLHPRSKHGETELRGGIKESVLER